MKIKFPFHPFFFAAYAVIGVFSLNANEIPPEQIVRPLILILTSTSIVYFAMYMFFNTSHRAALLTTLWIFWAIYFGHVYRFANNFRFVRDLPEHRLVVLILWTALTGVFALPQVWNKFLTAPDFLTTMLNVASTVVLILPILTTMAAVRKTSVEKAIIERRQAYINIKLAPQPDMTSDIYYIILDGYGRQDILETYFKYDNLDFINYLREKGFYVADESQSNYMQTQLSVSSSLNFEYINDLQNDLADSNNRGPLAYLIDQNRARHLLKEQGYQFVNVESVTLFMRLRDADIYLAPSASFTNEFESLLLTTSVADIFIERFFPNIPLLNYETHRKYIKYQFNTLSEIPKMPGKKFVFVHILAPHPPFIFDSKGIPIEPNRPYFGGDASGFFGSLTEYDSGYTGEMTYINSLLKLTIDKILATSKQPPIIILQSDHGPGSHTSFVSAEDTCSQERFSILNAYYFPGQDYSGLSPDITPVNTFREVFNQFFDAHLDLLQNKNFYSTWLRPYQFINTTDKVNLQCNIAK